MSIWYHSRSRQWKPCDASSLCTSLGSMNIGRARRWTGERPTRCTQVSVRPTWPSASSHGPCGRDKARARRHRLGSRDDEGPSSLLSSGTWKAANIFRSLNCAERRDQVLGADLWQLRRQQCAVILKVRPHRPCRRADSHARARNRDGGQTIAADSGAS